VQAHTLGEVGVLGIVLLRVYSWTMLPFFIEIGLYLTDKEQKISWHSFFWDTVYNSITCIRLHAYVQSSYIHTSLRLHSNDMCTSTCSSTGYSYQWSSYEWTVHGHSYKHKHL